MDTRRLDQNRVGQGAVHADDQAILVTLQKWAATREAFEARFVKDRRSGALRQ